MSVPINFNTTSLDELKTVLSKNKSQAVIKACEKFGHLSITAFRTATKLLTAQCQKMLNGGAMIYEVDTSAPILPEDTPPASEDSSPFKLMKPQWWVPLVFPVNLDLYSHQPGYHLLLAGHHMSMHQVGGHFQVMEPLGIPLPGHRKNEPPLRWRETQQPKHL